MQDWGRGYSYLDCKIIKSYGPLGIFNLFRGRSILTTYNKTFCIPTYVFLEEYKPCLQRVARIFNGRKATAALFNLIMTQYKSSQGRNREILS